MKYSLVLFKFEFGSKWFEFIKDFKNGKLTLSGLRGKDLTRPSRPKPVNPANPARVEG
jgi:hypothetical protein